MQIYNQGVAIINQASEQISGLVSGMFNPNSCLDILGQQDGLFIKQKFELFEALTGCETPNIYKVYAANDQGKKLKQKALFKCKEKSGTCERVLCPGNMRPFKMKIKNYGCRDFQGKLKGNDDNRLIFEFNRVYQLTCLCFNRPSIDLMYVENNQSIKLGRIINPWYLCNIGCHVLDIYDNVKYIVEASCCQTYFWCRLPCNKCNKVQFTVRTQDGQIVSYLMKKGKDCCTNMISDADNFSVIFPKQSSKEDKALLLAVILMMDYMYFENNQNSTDSTVSAI